MLENNENIYFSIVALCYKGGKSVIPLVERMHRMLSNLTFSWEIILIGNYLEGENDETPQIVKGLEQKLTHVRALTLPKKGMTGWDLRMGLGQAKGKYIGFIDADGQMPLESIIACLDKISCEPLDMVKTYRISRADGLYRRFISWVYNWLFRLLFKVKVRDINSNPKIFLKARYDQLDLRSDDWFIDAEMILRANQLGFRIGEVPMHFLALQGRDSFVKTSTIWEFLRNMYWYKTGKGLFSKKLINAI